MGNKIKFKYYLKDPASGEITTMIFDYSQLFVGIAHTEILKINWIIIDKVEFTGLLDNERNEIFEKDVLANAKEQFGVVKWEGGRFGLQCKRKGTTWFIPLDSGFVKNKIVVGNTIENPEYL